MPDLVTLRAEVAKRAEDARIAYKHMTQAAGRPFSAENERAYLGSVEWYKDRREAERQARSRLIAETIG